MVYTWSCKDKRAGDSSLFPPCRSRGENSDHGGRQAISGAPLSLSGVILVLVTDVYKQI